MAFRDLSKNLGGNLTNRYLSRYPHYSCLGPNLHSIQLFGEVDDLDPRLISGESIPFKYSLPVPLLRMKEAPKSFLFGRDPGLDIVHQKARWKENIQRELALVLARKRYKDVPLIEKELQRKKKMKRLPTHVVLLSKLLEYDPCSEFDGVYNWYYSGGCLCHVAFNGQDFLLRPGGNHFDRLDAIPLCKGENVYFDPKLENTTKFYMGNKSPIYQIIANQEHGLVGIRQRRKCKILSTMESDEILRFCTVDNCKSSTTTFTSIDLDGANEGNYATMDTASNVHIRSVDCSASFISKWSVPGCSDNGFDKWCSAQFGQNKDSVICINRQVIRTYDIRARNMNTMEFSLKDYPNVEKCEEISCLVKGSEKSSHPLLYVATSHNLHGLDLRFPRAFVQRWTHGMETSPSYACIAHVNSGNGGNPLEVVVLRSQTTNELRAIVNHPSSETNSFPFSNFFPISLPSYYDVLKFGHWHGRLLDPATQRRLSMSSMGMCSFVDGGGVITCLSQNSLGDVFQQHIIPKECDSSLMAEDVVRMLKKWEKSMPKELKPRKKLETVIRTDMRSLVKRVTQNPKDQIRKPKPVNTNWKISKRKVLTYTDMLAERIRVVWQLDDEDEWNSDEEVEKVNLMPSQDPAEKVKQWLGTANDMVTSTPVASQGTLESVPPSFKPQLLESQLSEFENVDSPAAALVQEAKRRLSVLESGRAKRRRVDGF